jgi:cytochrome c553
MEGSLQVQTAEFCAVYVTWPIRGTGYGTKALPRLAGQHAQYTENQLKAFNKRERTNDNAVMHGIASKLTELELKAVASYISGLE